MLDIFLIFSYIIFTFIYNYIYVYTLCIIDYSVYKQMSIVLVQQKFKIPFTHHNCIYIWRYFLNAVSSSLYLSLCLKVKITICDKKISIILTFVITTITPYIAFLCILSGGTRLLSLVCTLIVNMIASFTI